ELWLCLTLLVRSLFVGFWLQTEAYHSSLFLSPISTKRIVCLGITAHLRKITAVHLPQLAIKNGSRHVILSAAKNDMPEALFHGKAFKTSLIKHPPEDSQAECLPGAAPACLLFHCGLKPWEIVRFSPQEWSDVQAINQLRRTIFERFLA
ncbi:MAG TPA: hypothetical protein VFQ30_20255, partial [Ktedonobacteraceae bacterium]|nr:hypothetical protein [Ktedonobacteraceae bacterium]